jgi:putative membrane protein
MWWHGPWNWGAWLAMTATMVVFWALVIWAVVSVVRGIGPGSDRRAEAILAERFARGEIDEDEYPRRLDTLRRAGSRV